jgi:hypothetical protein
VKPNSQWAKVAIMTKYDKIFGVEDASEESLSPEEAVAAIAVITAIADSPVEEVDAESLAGVLWEFEVFEEYTEDEIVDIVERLISIAEEEGLGPLFNTANASLSDDIVLDGFAAGVIVLLDQELTIPKQKQPYLKKLQEALEIEDEEAQEIIQEVIAAIQEAEEGDEAVILGDQVYTSPLGNFTVAIPVDPQQGGRIQSQDGVVGFYDDLGTLLRIDYYPLPSDQIKELASQGQEQYLQSILLDKYVPQAIFANLPEAQIRYTEYLKDDWQGSYYALVDMPKGFKIPQQENNGTATRLDAYRGLLAFINGEFLYIVSSQRSFLDGETPSSVKEEAQEIKKNILEFVQSIEFN